MKVRAKIIKRSLKINGESLELVPLDLERTLELIIHLSPYVALAEKYLPEIQRALNDTSGGRPGALFSIFQTMREDFRQSPQDIVKAVAILLDKPPQWVALNVTGAEIVRIIKDLDRTYDLQTIWGQTKQWAAVELVK